MRTYCGSKCWSSMWMWWGRKICWSSMGVGEEDLLSGLILLYSMTVTFSTNPIWAYRPKRVMMAALLR